MCVCIYYTTLHHMTSGAGALALTRTCYFAILEHNGGGTPAVLLCPCCNRASQQNERKVWDVLNPAMPDLTILGHMLSSPAQVKNISFLHINLSLRNVEKMLNSIMFMAAYRIETFVFWPRMINSNIWLRSGQMSWYSEGTISLGNHSGVTDQYLHPRVIVKRVRRTWF